jgi:hypothetical protein
VPPLAPIQGELDDSCATTRSIDSDPHLQEAAPRQWWCSKSFLRLASFRGNE